MRVKFNPTTVSEVIKFDFTPYCSTVDGTFGVSLGFEEACFTAKDKRKFAKKFGDDYSGYDGELDVSDCVTFEEACTKAERIIDELFKIGVLDLSTEEKRKQYGIILW